MLCHQPDAEQLNAELEKLARRASRNLAFRQRLADALRPPAPPIAESLERIRAAIARRRSMA